MLNNQSIANYLLIRLISLIARTQTRNGNKKILYLRELLRNKTLLDGDDLLFSLIFYVFS